jgi:transposase
MTYHSKYIDKHIIKSASKELDNLGRFSMLPIKLNAIISCDKNQIKDVAKIIGFSRRSLTKWIKDFKYHGIKGLEAKKGRGRKPIITDKIRLRMQDIINHDSNVTIMILKSKIEKEFNIKVSKATIYNNIKDLGFSYISSRQKHYKQNELESKAFKKNSNQR